MAFTPILSFLTTGPDSSIAHTRGGYYVVQPSGGWRGMISATFHPTGNRPHEKLGSDFKTVRDAKAACHTHNGLRKGQRRS